MQKHLDSNCETICRKEGCPEVVKQGPHGGWYITIGHAGFNSPANNRMGYASEQAAKNANARYSGKGAGK